MINCSPDYGLVMQSEALVIHVADRIYAALAVLPEFTALEDGTQWADFDKLVSSSASHAAIRDIVFTVSEAMDTPPGHLSDAFQCGLFVMRY
jgi:hypothetical protein